MEFPNLENREAKKEYSLLICVTRHGEKGKDEDGDMFPQSVENAKDYFRDAYDGIDIGEGDRIKRKVASSPKGRARQTADAYQVALSEKGIKPLPVNLEEALSEGDVMVFYEKLSEEEKGEWFQHWYEAKERTSPDLPTGKEVGSRFASWLLNEIAEAQEEGGKHETDAFSHGPAMASFLLNLEEKLGIDIFDVEKARKINKNILFSNYKEGQVYGFLHCLSNINFDANSDSPDEINLICFGNKFSIPISAIKEIAGNKFE